MAHVPYANAVGSLMYAMVGTRQDIAHAMGVLSRYMVTPRKEHWTVVKRVFRYLRGTIDLAIYYHENSEEVRVHGFVESDWARDIDSRRSTSGYVLKLFGSAISWMSRKRSMVALSTTEVEYIAVTQASREIL